MKRITQNIFIGLGYKLVEKNYFNHLIHINKAKTDACYLLLKKKFAEKADLVFFDIGANVGQTTNKIKEYFPDSAIYCFEPISDTYKQLVENIRGFKDVHSFQNALGSESGRVEIFHRKDSEWNSLLPLLNKSAKKEGGKSEFIQVDTLDEFINNHNIAHIDFLKTDTEGFELEVLNGGKESFQSGIIDMVYVEVGFSLDDNQHVHWKEVVQKMEEYHFSFVGFFESSYTKDLHIMYANALFVKD